MEQEESRENTEVLFGEEISEEQLLQQLRERSILLNLDLVEEVNEKENQEKYLLPVKNEEVIEEKNPESGLFTMPMNMDNTNRPANTGKTKKEIYDYMSVDIQPQSIKKDKSNLMDVEFSREKIKTKNTDLNRTDKKRVPKAGLAKKWFLMKVETEVEEIMDIYYCKKAENKWKLQL